MEPVQTQLQFKPLFDFEYLIWTRIEFAQTFLQLQRPNLEFKWVPVQSQSLTSFGFKLNVFNIQLKTFICLWSFTLVWKGTHSSTFSVLIFSRLKWSWTQSFAAANKRHWCEKRNDVSIFVVVIIPQRSNWVKRRARRRSWATPLVAGRAWRSPSADRMPKLPGPVKWWMFDLYSRW